MRKEKLNTDKFKLNVLSAYIAISGIFWLPGIPSGLLSYLKFLVYFILSVLGIISYEKINKKILSLIIGLLFCAGISLVSALLYYSIEESIESARSFFEPMLWLIAMSCVDDKNITYFIKQFRKIFVPVGLLYAVPILVFLGMIGNIYPQGNYASAVLGSIDSDFQFEQLSVAFSGFTGSRVGWGIVVATSILFYLAARAYLIFPSRTEIAVAILLVFGGILSIMSTGARGGVLVLSLFGIWSILKLMRSSSNKFITVGFLIPTISITVILLLPHLSIPDNYFRGFEFGGNTEETVNSITTGRLDTIIKSLEKLQTSPWFGLGVEGAKVRLGDDTELSPHNVWIRILCERGIVAIIPVMYLTVLILTLATGNRGRYSRPTHNFGLVVYAGMLIGLSEPAAIFGSMNTNLPFWTAVYICAKFR